MYVVFLGQHFLFTSSDTFAVGSITSQVSLYITVDTHDGKQETYLLVDPWYEDKGMREQLWKNGREKIMQRRIH